MNDQPTSDALSRASAYVDGELDAAEIAAVETDPAAMAQVTRLRSLQEAIRDVPAPTSHARDIAITAALAEFDRGRQPARALRSRPAPAYGRWLAVAAAVAGLAVLGAVITQAGRDDDDSSTALEATAATEFAAAGDAADQSARSVAAGAPSASQPDAAQTQLAPAPTSTPAAPVSAEAGAIAEAAATTAAASDAGGVQTFDPNTPIADEFELGRVGHQLLAEVAAGSRLAKAGTPCDASVPDAVLLSDALLIVDGTPRPVLLAGNPATDETFALDPGTCVVVVTGR
jgi:hypothetical protein